jgi:hypothetical protein
MKGILDAQSLSGFLRVLLSRVESVLFDDSMAQDRARVVTQVALILLNLHPSNRLAIPELIIRKPQPHSSHRQDGVAQRWPRLAAAGGIRPIRANCFVGALALSERIFNGLAPL